MKKFIWIYILLLCSAVSVAQTGNGVLRVNNVRVLHEGEDMRVKADFVLDSLTLRNNRVMVLTPVLEDSTGHVATFRPVMLTGRNQHFVYLREGSRNYPDAIEVRRMNGTSQSVPYDCALSYENWMSEEGATVRVNVDDCGCGDLLSAVASDRYRFNSSVKCPFLMPDVDKHPEIFIEGAAYVTYELDSITLKPHMFDNPHELFKIYSDIEKVHSDSLLDITSVSIHGFASPEGRYDHNVYLARERAKTLLAWVRNECSRMNVSVGNFSYDFTPENWEGLVDSLMNHPEMSHRDEILAIATSAQEPDARDDNMRMSYPSEYGYMLDKWYPYLRHADYRVGFRLGQVSLEQIRTLVTTRPQVLSLNQLLMAAQSYEVGSDEFRQVFDVAVRMYPDDETVNVNAACAALLSGDAASAGEYLKKSGNSPQAMNARGALAVMEGRYDEAAAQFRAANEAGLVEAGYNLTHLSNFINNIISVQ